MKWLWRRLLSFYFRLAGRYRQWQLNLVDGPIEIELGSPWKRGFKIQSHSSWFPGVQRRYLRAGGAISAEVSYLYMGECVGFGDLLDEWQEAEREYAAVGFRTFPIENLAAFGGWGKTLDGVGLFRDAGEKPVYHALLYRKHYYGKRVPMSVQKHPGGMISGEWLPPHTGHLDDDDCEEDK